MIGELQIGHHDGHLTGVLVQLDPSDQGVDQAMATVRLIAMTVTVRPFVRMRMRMGTEYQTRRMCAPVTTITRMRTATVYPTAAMYARATMMPLTSMQMVFPTAVIHVLLASTPISVRRRAAKWKRNALSTVLVH